MKTVKDVSSHFVRKDRDGWSKGRIDMRGTSESLCLSEKPQNKTKQSKKLNCASHILQKQIIPQE